MSQVPIGRDEDIEPARFRLREEVPIAEDRPPHLEGRHDFMLCEGASQRRWHPLIEEDAHSGRCEGTGSVREHGTRLGEADAREPVDKILDLSPVLQVLEQGGNGYTGTAKHPGAANTGWITLDIRARGPVDHAVSLDPYAEADKRRLSTLAQGLTVRQPVGVEHLGRRPRAGVREVPEFSLSEGCGEGIAPGIRPPIRVPQRGR